MTSFAIKVSHVGNGIDPFRWTAPNFPFMLLDGNGNRLAIDAYRTLLDNDAPNDGRQIYSAWKIGELSWTAPQQESIDYKDLDGFEHVIPAWYPITIPDNFKPTQYISGLATYLPFGLPLAESDGLAYIASYGDLIQALGANEDAGTAHYNKMGFSEGRLVSFDGLQYIASYGDLIEAFHTQVRADPSTDIGATHYIIAGYFEGRASDHFDAAQYVANYADLQAAFASNLDAAAFHYIANGYFEGRTDDPFI